MVSIIWCGQYKQGVVSISKGVGTGIKREGERREWAMGGVGMRKAVVYGSKGLVK